MQRGQAPCGELNEKMRGCSSGSETPCSGQAKFSEKSSSLAVDHVDRDEALARARPRSRPTASSRVRRSGFITSRSTTTSIVCLNFLSRTISLLEQPLLAVDLHAREAVAAQLLEDVAVLALAVADDRRVDREARALGQREDLVDDRLDGLAGDRAAADRAVRPADARVEQAQVVVDLGDRADRRARVARGRLLVDRDRRREAVDGVDVGLLHHLQELARVRGERLDVAALALGVDRVEGERRLAGPGEPGDADEGVPRQPDGDVLEVVLAGAVDDQLVGSHRRRLYRPNVRSHRAQAYAPRRTSARNPVPGTRTWHRFRSAGIDAVPAAASPRLWKRCQVPVPGTGFSSGVGQTRAAIASISTSWPS